MTRFERHQVDARPVEAKSEPKQRDEEGRGHDEPAVVKARCRRSLNGDSIVHGPKLESVTGRAPAVIGPDPPTESDFSYSGGCVGASSVSMIPGFRVRLGDMRPRSAGPRCGLSRVILYSRPYDADLLPTGVPGAACTFGQRHLLRFGSRSGTSRFLAMPAPSPRVGSGKSRIERDSHHRGPCGAPY